MVVIGIVVLLALTEILSDYLHGYTVASNLHFDVHFETIQYVKQKSNSSGDRQNHEAAKLYFYTRQLNNIKLMMRIDTECAPISQTRSPDVSSLHTIYMHGSRQDNTDDTDDIMMILMILMILMMLIILIVLMILMILMATRPHH